MDIYATKSLRDFVYSLSRVILDGLKPAGRKALETFWNSVKSLQAGISFDPAGNPSFNLQLGDIHAEETTLDEIFHYLEKANRRVLVAIDEFQQIASYPEKNVEALLRTHVQHCTNARFVFAGSQRHVMGNMFTSASRPFYQSVSMMYLEPIGLSEYETFAERHFRQKSKRIAPGMVSEIYIRFDGITWYVQKMLNMLFSLTPEGGECTSGMIREALRNILDSYKYTFREILFRLPERQKEVLIAINKEGPRHSIRGIHQKVQPARSEFRTGSSQGIAGKGFHHARTRRLPYLRPFLRPLAERKLLTYRIENRPAGRRVPATGRRPLRLLPPR